jgi:glutamate racemase
LIVVACNTASAIALGDLTTQLMVPLCGVVDPGAKQAVLLSKGHTIAVVATEATIGSDAYRRAITKYQPAGRVIQKPCPLFVPVVEEGRTCDDPIVLALVRDYLGPLMSLDPKVLVLGCTHYPLLKPAIAEFVGPSVQIVDSGEQTAATVVERLTKSGALAAAGAAGGLTCYVSDNPQRFRELGQRFLNEPIVDVTWVSQDQFHSSAPAYVGPSPT